MCVLDQVWSKQQVPCSSHLYLYFPVTMKVCSSPLVGKFLHSMFMLSLEIWVMIAIYLSINRALLVLWHDCSQKLTSWIDSLDHCLAVRVPWGSEWARSWKRSPRVTPVVASGRAVVWTRPWASAGNVVKWSGCFAFSASYLTTYQPSGEGEAGWVFVRPSLAGLSWSV